MLTLFLRVHRQNNLISLVQFANFELDNSIFHTGVVRPKYKVGPVLPDRSDGNWKCVLLKVWGTISRQACISGHVTLYKWHISTSVSLSVVWEWLFVPSGFIRKMCRSLRLCAHLKTTSLCLNPFHSPPQDTFPVLSKFHANISHFVLIMFYLGLYFKIYIFVRQLQHWLLDNLLLNSIVLPSTALTVLNSQSLDSE